MAPETRERRANGASPRSIGVTSARPPTIVVKGGARASDGVTLFPRLEARFEGGRWTCLLGRSGVGKSSLLRAISGLLGPDVFDGFAAADDGAPLSGRTAWMAQDALLPPWLAAREAVAMGARMRGDPIDPNAARAVLAACGIAALADRRPDAMSGGQRQRVALARTLFEDRPVALLDEPLAALDALTRSEMIALLWRRLGGRTVIHVTHDPLEAARLAERVAILTQTGIDVFDAPGAPLRAWDASETIVLARRIEAKLIAG